MSGPPCPCDVCNPSPPIADQVAGFVKRYTNLTVHPEYEPITDSGKAHPRLVNLAMKLTRAELATLHTFLGMTTSVPREEGKQ